MAHRLYNCQLSTFKSGKLYLHGAILVEMLILSEDHKSQEMLAKIVCVQVPDILK